MRALLRLLAAICFSLMLLRPAYSAQTEVESNLHFLEESIGLSASPFLDTLASKNAHTVVLSCEAAGNQQQAAQFFQDVALELLLARDYVVYLRSDESSERNIANDVEQIFWQITLDEWLFSAHRHQADSISQKLELTFRYRMLDRHGKVLSAGHTRSSTQRLLDDERMYQLVQAGQPDFARAVASFSDENNNLVNTLLISGVTGLTVFLIYSLRSK